MKNIFALFVLAFLMACAGMAGPMDYKDGTWSTCTYSKDGRVITPPPMQMGGAPMEWTEPDGTSVKCTPMK